MVFNKKRFLLNVFFMAQFSYCQLVWMFHNRTKNKKVKRLQERCHRLIYNDQKLEIDSSVSTHDRYLRALVFEMYKINHEISQNRCITVHPSLCVRPFLHLLYFFIYSKTA